MYKYDLVKQHKTYFTAKTQPELVEIEPAQFISIRGKGDPSGRPFAERVGALYATAYTLKFAFKARNNDFVVSRLEGLWWFDEDRYAAKSISAAPHEVPRSDWEYRLLIRLPHFVTKQALSEAIAAVLAKKKLKLAEQIEFYTMHEGKCVQVLHIGPFSTEQETLQEIAGFMEANNLKKNGHHHEIYLSDFRKVEPEKLRTILREPVC